MSRFVVYRDTKKEWRWYLKSRNGLKIADSAEGYKRKAGALKAIELVRVGADEAEIEIE